MIITCEQCQAQFQLPDERIPEKGARVRCSKCKHAFFVARAGSGAAPATAPQAAAPKPAPSAASKASPRAAGPAPRPEREEDVGDWGFNEDVKAKSGSFGKPKANLDANLFEEPNPDLSEVKPVVENDSPFGEALGASGFAAASPASPPAEDLGGDFSDLFSEEKTAASSEREAPAEASSDGAGGIDDWDFFGDAQKKDASASAAAAQGMDDFFDSLAKSSDRPVPKPAVANVAPVVLAPPIKKAPPLPPWFNFVSSVAGWCIVAVMVLVIAFESMTPAATFVAPEEGVLKIGTLAADGVRGRMIENSVSGMVYVVSGQLRNDTNASVPAGAAIRVVLIDEQGNAVADTAPAMAGFALADHQLREEKLDELRQKLEADAAHLAWSELEPKETVQFDALFLQMPDAAVGFRLETVDVAKPAPQPAAWMEGGSEAGGATLDGVAGDVGVEGLSNEAGAAAAPEIEGQPATPEGDASGAAQPAPASDATSTPTDPGASPASPASPIP